jgi:hypothetical protein
MRLVSARLECFSGAKPGMESDVLDVRCEVEIIGHPVANKESRVLKGLSRSSEVGRGRRNLVKEGLLSSGHNRDFL